MELKGLWCRGMSSGIGVTPYMNLRCGKNNIETCNPYFM
jgi:hypothetical protein